MKKLIIGCGYLGCRVADAWKTQGDEVWALTRSAERARTLASAGIQPVIGDIMDVASLAAIGSISTPDVILYAVARDRSSPISMEELYLTGLRNVMSQFEDFPSRWIYISSTSVYGQNQGEWVDEMSECRPESDNGKICLQGEQLFQQYVANHPESRGHVLRLAGIYGPDRLIARLTGLIAGVPLQGRPDAWLNLIHVDDAVQAILAIERVDAAGEICLVADDRPVQREEYYSLLSRLAGGPPPRFELASSGDSVEINKRCCNAMLRKRFQVELLYPTIAEGLPHALSLPQ
ncbi:MAG: SDR family oxidoreductase [Planctomycetaceae bacterium]